jgi:hypothetical protein
MTRRFDLAAYRTTAKADRPGAARPIETVAEGVVA